MGAVADAQELVDSLIKKTEARIAVLEQRVKHVEGMRENLKKTFEESTSDIYDQVSNKLDGSIESLKDAVKSVEESKKELEKCRGQL
jgi:DNA repair exonuclease SbcCD ATPase subunit